jgi:hypothetical protein
VSEAELDIAVDNDLVLKAVCFRLAIEFWPLPTSLGVLGAAKYVLAKAVTGPNVSGDPEAWQQALREFFERTVTLEPTEAEIAFAADLVLLAQKNELELDTGEAQLTAIVIKRAIAFLETGDKRAVSALEAELDLEPRLAALHGRVRCLEQLVAAALVDDDALGRVRAGVCAEPALDKALSICFACASDCPLTLDAASDALTSYIESLRGDAPRTLAP